MSFDAASLLPLIRGHDLPDVVSEAPGSPNLRCSRAGAVDLTDTHTTAYNGF